MNTLRFLVFVVVSILMLNCKSKPIEKSHTALIIPEGYFYGVVEEKKILECDFIIKDINSEKRYHVFNANTKPFKVLNVPNTKVFFKFRRLRIKPSCNSISVIELIDIKKAEY